VASTYPVRRRMSGSAGGDATLFATAEHRMTTGKTHKEQCNATLEDDRDQRPAEDGRGPPAG